MNALRKPATLAVIAAFALGLAAFGSHDAVGVLVILFVLYLLFGDS